MRFRVFRLSHVTRIGDPVYPGNEGPVLEQVRSIARGDSSNAWRLSLTNHIGTHVDAPNHFDDAGPRISEFGPEELTFRGVRVLDVPKSPGEVIAPEDLRGYGEELRTSEAVLIRTGLQRHRSRDPETYANVGISLSVEAARLIASFGNLRAIGIDAISISSPLRREMGREAHRVLLRGRRFLIVEDMDLEGKPERYDLMLVAPLAIDLIDSAPCTVYGLILEDA
ncbi:MAG: cyclase family protein [Nitrososphaerota archaeon]|nr:cyclase family protein [Candidatus Calditenuis fumarioli]